MSNKFFWIGFVCLMVLPFYTHAQVDAQDDAAPELPSMMTEQEVRIVPEAMPLTENEGVIDPNFLNDSFDAYDDYKKVVVRILDKITADTRTFDLNIGKTVAYGSLRLRPMTCKKAPPIDEPESASFLQIWEKTPEATDEWVFSGWMFASSPSLSSMEHPVYDVWVIDCKD